MKQCKSCKNIKSPSEFNKDNSKKDKLQSYCRACSHSSNQTYYEDNKEKVLKNSKQNQTKYHYRRKELYHTKWKKNAYFKIATNLRKRIRQVIKNENKSVSMIKLLGCSKDELRAHLERQFTAGMTWDNYGVKGWHIDHRKPCASFDLTIPEQQKICFHYTNLQPLWAKDNLSKGSREKNFSSI